MSKIKDIYFKTISDFRAWLIKNHIKENKVGVIRYKKHTGKNSPSYLEFMHEAICFGWIDTTVNKIDNEKYKINFCKRTKNSKWSDNTLSYAKKMIEENRMQPQGLYFYQEGLKKPTHDFGIPKNPDIPEELKKELNKVKNKNVKLKFEKLCPSIKRMYFRSILKAKLSETKTKRINEFILFLKNKS